MLSDEKRKEVQKIYMLPTSKKIFEEFVNDIAITSIVYDVPMEDAYNEAMILVRAMIQNKEANGDMERLKEVQKKFSDLMDLILK